MSAIHPHQLIFSDGEFKNSYSKSKIEQIAKRAYQYWTASVPKPDIALISNRENSAKLSILRDFLEWTEF
jgi:hypothetical protein